MIEENQLIAVKWSANTKNHFVEKGYNFTRFEDEFKVRPSDLTKGSHIKVKFICDKCLGMNQTKEEHKFSMYRKLYRNQSEGKLDYCVKCTSGNAGLSNFKKESSLLNKSPEIAKEWNFKRNTETPDLVGHRSGRKFWWICDKGHEWESTVGNRTTRKNGCPYCGNKKVCGDNNLQFLYPHVAKEWHPTKNGKLTPSSVVATTKKKVWWQCVVDKSHVWESQISNRIYNGHGCPMCNESKGEKRIREILVKNKLIFKSQYEFNNLFGTGNGKLKFDFVLLKQEKPVFIIEYDGEFHYKKFYKDDGHETLLVHDQIKNKYCEQNNIPLLRIPYWEFDTIEEILFRELKKFNLLTPF